MIWKLLQKWLLKNKRNNLPYRLTGSVPSPTDERDFEFVLPIKLPNEIPRKMSLPGWTIKNQMFFQSCTAHAVCTAAEILFANSYGLLPREAQLSERYNWYYTRKDYMKSLPYNTGVYIRDAIKCAQKQGLSPEVLCPYDRDVMNVAPSVVADSFARIFCIGEYCQINCVNEVRTALAAGFPVIIGMKVWKEFKEQDYLLVKKPPKDTQWFGGHAMVIVGYDDDKNTFLLLNSWDSGWGMNGRAELPYDLFSNDDLVYEAYSISRMRRRD